MTYEELKKANELIQTTDIKGKQYAEVPQRIKAFRSVYPEGCILTEMLSNEGGVCVFSATVYADSEKVLATGHAYEKEGSTFINKTSYIENCETSAVGRALGMCGLGIDTSIASFEEVSNAQLQQKIDKAKSEAKQASNEEFQSFIAAETEPEKLCTKVQVALIRKACDAEQEKAICKSRKVTSLEALTARQAEGVINGLIQTGRLEQ